MTPTEKQYWAVRLAELLTLDGIIGFASWATEGLPPIEAAAIGLAGLYTLIRIIFFLRNEYKRRNESKGN